MSVASPAMSCPKKMAWTSGTGASFPPRSETALPPDPPRQRVRIVLFFDGTMNNKYNTKARKNNVLPANIAEAAKSARASYANDYSNVARMFDSSVTSDPYKTSQGISKPYDQTIPIYVEGIGTDVVGTNHTGATDSTYGGATGDGATGIPAKVHKGIERALQRLKAKLSPEFEFVHVDVFGFSRGAAAARHSIHCLHNGWSDGDFYTPDLKTRLEMAEAVVNELKVRFAGLYDTVASFGVIHLNDTWELSLDAVKDADQVVHLAAAEEHRVNFRLTSIGSVGKRGLELYLPGVHSDIGGGYNSLSASVTAEHLVFWTERSYGILSSSPEEKRMRDEARWFETQGWCGTNGNRLQQGSFDLWPGKVWYVAGARKGRSNEYAMIPLNMLCDYAKQQGLVFSNPGNTGDPFLLGWAAKLRKYAKEVEAGKKSNPDDWFHETGQGLPELRAHYLHFSAYYQDVSEVVTLTSALVDAFGPMAPEYSGSRRTRVIQNG